MFFSLFTLWVIRFHSCQCLYPICRWFALVYMCVWAAHSCAPLPLHVSGHWKSLQQQQQLLTALTCLFDAHHSSEACLTHPSRAYKHQLPLCSTNDSIIMLKISRHSAHFLSFGPRHGERSVLIIASTELTAGVTGRDGSVNVSRASNGELAHYFPLMKEGKSHVRIVGV